MTSRLLITLFFLISPVLTSIVGAEEAPGQTEEDKKVYRKFHPDGVVEFSDKPLKGGEEIKVDEAPAYRFVSPSLDAQKKPVPVQKQNTAPTTTPTLRTKKLTPATHYSVLSITSPKRDETIRANDGSINVSFTLSPDLQLHNGHKLIDLLDGRIALKTTHAQALKNVERGTHTLVLQVVDKSNKVLIHSDSVSFHVKRFFKPRSQKKPAPREESVFENEFES